ncbi:MAG: TolC family protein [Chlamydiales bacterium]|nr:TolC family protein [Chlamydiales bacterium]
MRKILFLVFICGFGEGGYTQCIDFETAWERVVNFAPALAGADATIWVLEGEQLQASLLPNPVLGIVSEDLGISSRDTADVETPETTFRIEQLIELGGKRTARIEFAASQTRAAYWEALIKRGNAYLELTRAFIEARRAEEKWKIASARLEVREHLLEAAKREVQNGKSSSIREKKVRIEMMADRLALREAFSAYEQAKIRLAGLWGSACPDFESVAFDLFSFAPPPCEAEAQGAFYQTPDYLLALQIVRSAEKNISLQKAYRVPDVNLIGGYRRYHDFPAGGWVVGIEIPLPLFNRNQGAIMSANCGLSQAQYGLQEMTQMLQEKIATTFRRVAAAYEEIEEMSIYVLKEAEETLCLMQAGYEKGKFNYNDLLDAQKTVYDFQEQYIDLLSEYHLNRAELARLSGIKI